MTVREHILQEALALPPEDRLFLADHLEMSLTGGEIASPEIAATWNAEIERRLEAFERGEVRVLDASEAIDQMRNYLNQHREGTSRS